MAGGKVPTAIFETNTLSQIGFNRHIITCGQTKNHVVLSMLT